MDKTIEIVLVATVVLATAAIVLFLTQSKATDFSEFLGEQSEGAKCGLGETQYTNACNCDETPPETDKASQIRNKYQEKGCGWAGSTGGDADVITCGDDVCN